MSAVVEMESEVPTLGNLPEGWAAATLGEIGDYLNGRAFKASEWSKSGRPIIRIQDLTGSKSKPNFFKGRAEKRYVVLPGDFLISWAATLGAYIWLGPEGVLNQHIFKVHSKIDHKFHYYLANRILEELYQHTHGSGMVHITKGRFENIPVPIPPLAEQKRIVKKVEALLARVNTARERLARAPAILKRFRQGILAAAVTGQLTHSWRNSADSSESALSLIERLVGPGAIAIVPSDADPIEPPEIPDSWVWMRLEKLCRPQRAITYGVIKLGGYVKDGVPTLRSSDVRWLYIDNYDVKCISHKIASNYSRTFLKGGEILVTVRGTLGGVAVAPADMQGFNISREVALVPILSELEPFYFCYAIASIPSQNWLREVTKGVTYRGINIRDLKNLPLAVPPLAEQREIVCRVEALFKLADAIEKRVAAATIQADKLTQAILAKAFRGELVPTEAELARREGRDYETAAQLLLRIKSERAAITESKPTGAVSTAQ